MNTLLHIPFSKESFLAPCSHDAGGGAEALPARMQVLHYRVDGGPPPPLPIPDQEWEPSPCFSNTPQQRHLPVHGVDPVGTLKPVGADEEAQGRTESPLLSDSKSVPVTNLSTEVNAQTICTVKRSSTG